MEENLGKVQETRIKVLNPNKQPLTVEILKSLLRKEMSDEEGQEIVLAIKKLVSIIVDYQYEQELKEKNETDYDLKQAA
jgi:hypothetical protein